MLKIASKEDAKKIIEVMQTCYNESEFLNQGPNEFHITIEQEEKWIEKKNNDERACFYVIMLDDQIVGTIGLNPVSQNHYFLHEASLGICIVKKAWHKGLGQEAIQAAINKAKEIGYEMITLAVYAPNTRAIALYKSFGFEEYGRLKNKKKFNDGRYFDEVLMVKYL